MASSVHSSDSAQLARRRLRRQRLDWAGKTELVGSLVRVAEGYALKVPIGTFRTLGNRFANLGWYPGNNHDTPGKSAQCRCSITSGGERRQEPRRAHTDASKTARTLVMSSVEGSEGEFRLASRPNRRVVLVTIFCGERAGAADLLSSAKTCRLALRAEESLCRTRDTSVKAPGAERAPEAESRNE